MQTSLTGSLKDITIDYRTHKAVVSFLVNERVDGLDLLHDQALSIKVGKATKKRSLDANAYFHVLVGKITEKLPLMSFAAVKNWLITSYGQYEDMGDGVPLIYKTNAPPSFMDEREEVHAKFIKQSEDGAYWYRIYRGSHTYNSQEMARLIECTIQEAKDLGIETATPDEVARMNALWKEKRDVD